MKTKPVAKSKSKTADTDALILAHEAYEAVSLALALEGKADAKADALAHDLAFGQRNLGKLTALTVERKRDLSAPAKFKDAAKVIDKTPKPKRKARDKDGNVIMKKGKPVMIERDFSIGERAEILAKTKGTLLYARAMRDKLTATKPRKKVAK